MPTILKEKHDHAQLKFPRGFLWGTATSAHQVEGENTHSDWWNYEVNQQPPSLRSGQAADEYHLFKEDFALAKKLGHNAHRLSIEWARIEPSEGQFDSEAIEHYRQVLATLQKNGLKVMLTLWHFTLPQWVAERGGWENGSTVKYFLRFIREVVPEIKDLVDFWITLNEPDGYVYTVYQTKEWPGEHDKTLGKFKAYWNLSQAHKKAYQLLHQLDPKKPVGIAQNIQSYESYHKHSIREQLATLFSDTVSNHLFYLLTKSCHDFLGVNYYYHHRYKADHAFLPMLVDAPPSKDVSDLGWEIYPEGVFDILTDLADHLPIYITECGIASTNDDRRTRFLINYLQEVYQAIKAGAKVKGFFYWSLIDNFEWQHGFEPRFGLIEVDYRTQKRAPRTSAYVYQEIIEHNGIPHKLLKLLGHTLDVKAELVEIKKKDH